VDCSDTLPCGIDASFLCSALEVFEFVENLLDGVEVGAAGSEERPQAPQSPQAPAGAQGRPSNHRNGQSAQAVDRLADAALRSTSKDSFGIFNRFREIANGVFTADLTEVSGSGLSFDLAFDTRILL